MNEPVRFSSFTPKVDRPSTFPLNFAVLYRSLIQSGRRFLLFLLCIHPFYCSFCLAVCSILMMHCSRCLFTNNPDESFSKIHTATGDMIEAPGMSQFSMNSLFLWISWMSLIQTNNESFSKIDQWPRRSCPVHRRSDRRPSNKWKNRRKTERVQDGR